MTTNTKGKKPDFVALQATPYGDKNEAGYHDKNYWTEIGSAWWLEHKEGVSVKLRSLPLDGEFVLMPPKPPKKSSNNPE